MARGGRRQGIQGRNYTNRTDLTLNPKSMPIASGQTYGQRQTQEETLASIPRPTPLMAPTQRPEEPVTAGAALGPGPGPEVLPLGGPQEPMPLGEAQVVAAPFEAEIRAMYAAHPNEDLRELIEDLFDEATP